VSLLPASEGAQHVDLFWKAIAQLGTSTAIAGAIIYVFKRFFDHLLKRNLESEKAVLKQAGEDSLAR
jgi:hypothetical protein